MSSDSYPLTNITNPGQNDILCGRGGGTNAHPGNIKFRKLVAAHKLRYLAASKSDKPGVARDVVREWRSMDPPGRFLAKIDPTKTNTGSPDNNVTYWADVGDKKAREKASQCLRERNGAANEAVAALVKTVTANGHLHSTTQVKDYKSREARGETSHSNMNNDASNNNIINLPNTNTIIPRDQYPQQQQQPIHQQPPIVNLSSANNDLSAEEVEIVKTLRKAYSSQKENLNTHPNDVRQLGDVLGGVSIGNTMTEAVKVIEELRREKEDLKKKNQQLETDKKDLEEENGQLGREKEDLEEKNQQLGGENKALEEENQQLKTEKEDLEEENQQLGGENKALKEENQELEQKNKLSDITLQGKKRELERTQLFYKKEMAKLTDLYNPR